MRIRSVISLDTAKMLFNTIVMPHFDYCSILWGTAEDTYLMAVRLQKRAARIILKAPKFSRSSNLFKMLDWLPLKLRIEYHRAVLVYKALNGLAPAYLCSKFQAIVGNYNTRASKIKNFRVPKPKLEKYRSSFAYTGAVLWNSIPVNMRNAGTLDKFKELFLNYIRESR